MTESIVPLQKDQTHSLCRLLYSVLIFEATFVERIAESSLTLKEEVLLAGGTRMLKYDPKGDLHRRNSNGPQPPSAIREHSLPEHFDEISRMDEKQSVQWKNWEVSFISLLNEHWRVISRWLLKSP